LAVVAGWRVLLLAFYLVRGAGFTGFRGAVAVLFPLTLIVFTITTLNFEKVVFDFMGGIGETDRSVNDLAYGILFLISALSFLLFVPLLLSYLVMSVQGLVMYVREQKTRKRQIRPQTRSA
jgi:hypothetical protein